MEVVWFVGQNRGIFEVDHPYNLSVAKLKDNIGMESYPFSSQGVNHEYFRKSVQSRLPIPDRLSPFLSYIVERQISDVRLGNYMLFL